jgi:histidyl-tRNA synthetase
MGPMFRSERPQDGRQRQFSQIGAEAIGPNNPYIDAEVILLMMRLIALCGLESPELKINSLGCDKDKTAFQQILKKALAGEKNRLCGHCAKRYERNALRIFDCKNGSCGLILRAAPKITECLCADCETYFQKVKEALDSVGILYTVNPFLVRGLDYYTGTVFEVTHKNLGSQDAVAAGGRYDNLIREIGGEATPACGFAIGVERLLLAAKEKIPAQDGKTDIFLALLGEEAQKIGFQILTALREKGVSAQADFEGKSLKAQMRFADRIKAKRTLIIGEEEIKNNKAILRDMENKRQKEIKLEDAANTHLW